MNLEEALLAYNLSSSSDEEEAPREYKLSRRQHAQLEIKKRKDLNKFYAAHMIGVSFFRSMASRLLSLNIRQALRKGGKLYRDNIKRYKRSERNNDWYSSWFSNGSPCESGYGQEWVSEECSRDPIYLRAVLSESLPVATPCTTNAAVEARVHIQAPEETLLYSQSVGDNPRQRSHGQTGSHRSMRTPRALPQPPKKSQWSRFKSALWHITPTRKATSRRA